MAKRTTKLCDNGAQRRYDQVLAEYNGEATKWISAQNYHDLVITAHAGEFTTVVFPGGKCCMTPNPRTKLTPLKKIDLTACVVLEHKLGGCDDDEAMEIMRFNLDGTPEAGRVSERTQQHGCGFYRLRILDPADAESMAALEQCAILTIKRVNHRDF